MRLRQIEVVRFLLIFAGFMLVFATAQSRVLRPIVCRPPQANVGMTPELVWMQQFNGMTEAQVRTKLGEATHVLSGESLYDPNNGLSTYVSNTPSPPGTVNGITRMIGYKQKEGELIFAFDDAGHMGPIQMSGHWVDKRTAKHD